MNHRWIVCVTALVVAGFCGSAWADGKAFAIANATVTIPDQSALLHWAKGVETLVIDTTFQGSGGEMAWVVPVPSKPEVFPVTNGLFPTLRVIFRPKMVDEVDPFWAVGLLVAAVTYLVVRRRWLGSFLLVLAVLLYIFMLVPALGSAGGGAPVAITGVTVLDRAVIGSYDTATLSSTSPAELLTWLKDNGFVVPAGVEPVVGDYVKRGWVFVAAKLRRDTAAAGALAPHPLGLRFKSDTPVYPMKLTTTGNGALTVDLYVFGPGRAAAPGWKVERCVQPDYGKGARPPGVPVRHTGLRSLVDYAPVATKLTGRFASGEAVDDATIQWQPYAGKNTTAYSSKAMWVLVANGAVSVLALGLAIGVGVWGRGKSKAAGRRRVMVAAVILAVLWAVGCWIVLPVAPVQRSRTPVNWAGVSLYKGLDLAGHQAGLSDGTATAADYRRVMDRAIREVPPELWTKEIVTNRLTGQAVREEDSPGNYLLRDTPTGVDFIFINSGGGEEPMPLIEGRAPATTSAPARATAK